MFSHRNHTNHAYISLGSNLGDRAGNLLLALRGMMEAALVISRVSSVYETEPISEIEQPPFLNMGSGRYVANKTPPYSLPLVVDFSMKDGRVQAGLRVYPQVLPTIARTRRLDER